MTKLEDIVTRYYAAFNARDFDAYASLLSPDVELEFPGVSTRGLDKARDFDRAWVEAFPDARLECFRTSVAGSHVAAAIWFNGGSRRGSVKTPVGDVPNTGKALDCPGFVLFRFEGERIVKEQVMFEPAWIGIKLGLGQ